MDLITFFALLFQEPSSKRKKPNPDDNNATDHQGHVASGADDDGVDIEGKDMEASDKDSGYTDDYCSRK